MRLASAILLVCLGATGGAKAECVAVKYRDTCVPLEKLDCKTPVSSFVHQICYDEKNKYAVTLLRDTRYHYCNIPIELVKAWIAAPSVGRFYNEDIKGKFPCEGQPVPSY
jgi:hypothetical protein